MTDPGNIADRETGPVLDRDERPPSSVKSCLGVFSRLRGQNLSPRPPAMMITNRSLISTLPFIDDSRF